MAKAASQRKAREIGDGGALDAVAQATLLQADPNLETLVIGDVQDQLLRRRRQQMPTAVDAKPFTLDGDGASAAPPRDVAVIGRVGSYDLVDELGRGAMGVVYKAWSRKLARFVAVKVMSAGEHASEMEILRFQNEARLAARLNHPHIVQVFDAGETSGHFYFVMEYVEGRPLSPELPREVGLRALAMTARALQVAHEAGVVHRDVKPDNVLVDAMGEPHVTDFGIAKQVQSAEGLTHAGMIIGTPAFMAPEQVGQGASVGPQADVYALGSTLFKLLTGRPPFEGGPLQICVQLQHDDAPSAAAVAKELGRRPVPLDLDTICAKALERDPKRRYASALEMAEDIEAYLADRPVSARPVGRAERFGKLVRRNKAVFVGAAALVAALIVLTGALGAVAAFNVAQTSGSLREQDRRAAFQQATTLDRAIRTNMLEGRADMVRNLVNGLRDDPAISGVDVVRVDRTLAYTDRTTRDAVEERITQPGFIDEVAAERPALVPKIKELQRIALGAIDANAEARAGEGPAARFDVDPDLWWSVVQTGNAASFEETLEGEPILTVLQPVKSGEACMVCHDDAEGAYGGAGVRAVLVVQRSQASVEAQIASNERTTLWVGLGTLAVIAGLVVGFVRLFGARRKRLT